MTEKPNPIFKVRVENLDRGAVAVSSWIGDPAEETIARRQQKAFMEDQELRRKAAQEAAVADGTVVQEAPDPSPPPPPMSPVEAVRLSLAYYRKAFIVESTSRKRGTRAKGKPTAAEIERESIARKIAADNKVVNNQGKIIERLLNDVAALQRSVAELNRERKAMSVVLVALTERCRGYEKIFNAIDEGDQVWTVDARHSGDLNIEELIRDARLDHDDQHFSMFDLEYPFTAFVHKFTLDEEIEKEIKRSVDVEKEEDEDEDPDLEENRG